MYARQLLESGIETGDVDREPVQGRLRGGTPESDGAGPVMAVVGFGLGMVPCDIGLPETLHAGR